MQKSNRPIKFKIRLSTCDAVILSGQTFAVLSVSDDIIELQPLYRDGNIIFLNHGELADLIDQQAATINHGYFGVRETRRRAHAGHLLLSKLSKSHQEDVNWKRLWCEVFLEAEQNNEVSRSDASFNSFKMVLLKRVFERASPDGRSAKSLVEIASEKVARIPCRGSVMRWVRKWETTKDPMVLLKRSIFNKQNGLCLCAVRESLVAEILPKYFSLNKPSMKKICVEINRNIAMVNEKRQLAGQPRLPDVSESTVRRRLSEFEAFDVIASREGVSTAKNKLGPVGKGLSNLMPMQRIEIDEWQIDLLAIMHKNNVDISDLGLRDLMTGRYYLCVAIDVATRCIVGMKLSPNQSPDTAKSVVWMAMKNKTPMAQAQGCETPWEAHGHISEVWVDNGPAFVDSGFKAALSDLGIGYNVLPAARPQLRPVVERMFGTCVRQLMPNLTGRTFSNPKERGDYPSEKLAVHTAESLVEVFMRYIVDIYHNQPHSGLNDASPNDMWDKLTEVYGKTYPRDDDVLRHILGVPLTRKSSREGILFCGVYYHSERLADHFMKHNSQELEIRTDPENMGKISIWIEDAWYSLRAKTDGLSGVSFDAWKRLVRKLRQGNRNAAALKLGVIDRALTSIREKDAEQRTWRVVGPALVTPNDIKRAEAEVFYGLNITDTPDMRAGRDVGDGSPPEQGLIGEVVRYSTEPEPPALNAPKTPSKRKSIIELRRPLKDD